MQLILSLSEATFYRIWDPGKMCCGRRSSVADPACRFIKLFLKWAIILMEPCCFGSAQFHFRTSSQSASSTVSQTHTYANCCTVGYCSFRWDILTLSAPAPLNLICVRLRPQRQPQPRQAPLALAAAALNMMLFTGLKCTVASPDLPKSFVF